MTPMQIFWVVLLIGAVALLAVLFARSMRSGDREVGAPTSVDVKTHDGPPAGSDAEIAQRRREHTASGAEKAHELRDIDRGTHSPS